MERHTRQTFLGDRFLRGLDSDFISIVGLGGGGSVIASEFAHIGQKNYFLCDPDNFEDSNINRTLGSRFEDATAQTSKVTIAERTIRGVMPQAQIVACREPWQKCIEVSEFKKSKLIFSCLDDFSTRVQLESFARRNGIPLIDIGLTVKEDVDGFQMMGQVVLSHPLGPCFKCYNFISDKELESEARNYGDVGIRPQVIWANGILASTAVGVGVDLQSNWTKTNLLAFYKHLNGNKLELFTNLKVQVGAFDPPFKCAHF